MRGFAILESSPRGAQALGYGLNAGKNRPYHVETAPRSPRFHELLLANNRRRTNVGMFATIIVYPLNHDSFTMPQERTLNRRDYRSVGICSPFTESSRLDFFRFSVLVMMLACLLSCQGELRAQSASGPSLSDLEVGVDGHFKLGFWTHLKLTVSAGDSDVTGRLRWTAPDGDGVNVIYEDQEQTTYAAGSTRTIERLLKLGRTRSTVRVELVDGSERVIASQRVALSPDTGVLRSDELLIVSLGAESGFDRWIQDRSSQSSETAVSSVRIDTPAGLPGDAAALQTIDLLFVSVSDVELLADDYQSQWRAVVEWVRRGGVLVLCSGALGAEIAADSSPLSQLLPGTFESVVKQTNSTGAEMFTAASEQLLKERGESFMATRLTDIQGQVLAYEGQSEDALPLVVKSSVGMGRMLWVGIDLSAEPFASWKGRPSFISKLMDAIYPDAVQEDVGRRGRVGHLGYDDLSGQLRAALDQYGQVTFVTFTWVAILVTLFILLIGPGDFWLLKLVIRRMELTWVTSGLLVLGFCGLAVLLFNFTKGRDVQINQVELIDIDASTGAVRGTLWAHVYTPRLEQFDFWVDRSDTFTNSQGRTLLSWQGLSGTGLGGMDAQLSSNLLQASYGSRSEDSVPTHSNHLPGLAIQVASTRPLTARWWDSLEAPLASSLYADSRNNSLHGDVVNSLPFTLDRAIIYYDTWAYEVIGDLEPGESVAIEGQTEERTLESILARRRNIEGSDVSEPWDPKNDNLARIIEMMSFYKAAGGRDYTSLSHRLHADLDWSNHLDNGYAVLLGRANLPVSSMNNGEQSLADSYDQQSVMIRILLPVDQR